MKTKMRTEIDMGAKKVHLYAKDLSSPVRRKRNVQIVLYVTPVESMVHHGQVKNERNQEREYATFCNLAAYTKRYCKVFPTDMRAVNV